MCQKNMVVDKGISESGLSFGDCTCTSLLISVANSYNKASAFYTAPLPQTNILKSNKEGYVIRKTEKVRQKVHYTPPSVVFTPVNNIKARSKVPLKFLPNVSSLWPGHTSSQTSIGTRLNLRDRRHRLAQEEERQRDEARESPQIQRFSCLVGTHLLSMPAKELPPEALCFKGLHVQKKY